MIVWLNKRLTGMANHEFADCLSVRRSSFPVMPIQIDFDLMVRS